MKRSYVIPLRSAYRNKPKYKRTPKAVRAVKEFLEKHMKSEDVKLGQNLNRLLWSKGVKNPPAKVKVEVEKKDDVVYAELEGVKYHEPTLEDIKAEREAAEKAAKEAKKPGKKEDKKETEEASKAEKKSEDKKETKSEEPKKEAKAAPAKKATKTTKKATKKA
jgi:large subunit ribosomal protein L31e